MVRGETGRKEDRLDTTGFDTLTRTLARAGNRRKAVQLMVGGLTAGLLSSRVGTAVQARDFDQCGAPGDQGFARCNGTCVILSVDRFHCGACGVVCEAEERCQDGMCVPIPDFFPAAPAPLPVEEVPLDEIG